MAADTIQFVDSIGASPTVRLDINDQSKWKVARFEAPPPRLRRTVVSNAMSDGGYMSTSLYGPRTLFIDIDLVSTTQDENATELQKLNRELDRETNYLKYQPAGASQPVFFKVWRSDYSSLVDVPAALAFRDLSLELLADPFASGVRETINAGTVNTATGYFDVATASIKGDVEAPIILVDSNPYIGTSPGASNAVLNWLLARSTRSATSQPSMVQCSTLTMGSDTTVSSTDAVTAFTSTSSLTRLTWSPTGATAAAMRGTYRLMVGATGSSTTSDGTFSISAKYGSASYANLDAPTSFSETVQGGTTQKWLLDFGLIDFEAPSTLSLAPRLELIASVATTTHARSITWDFLYLVPADEGSALAAALYLPAGSMPSGGSYPTTNPMVFDGIEEDVSIASSTSIFSTATPILPGWVSYNGSIPTLKPGADNRFFYMRYASGITAAGSWSEYSTSGSGTITVYYYPLYLHVRPSTT